MNIKVIKLKYMSTEAPADVLTKPLGLLNFEMLEYGCQLGFSCNIF